MLTFLVRRVLVSIPVLVLISLSVFVLIRQAPGDPMTMFINPDAAAAGGPEYIERRREELGLNDPVIVQYAAFLGEAARGNLGYSVFTRRPVVDMLMERMPPTLMLVGSALAIGLLVSVPIGIFAAIRRNRTADYAATTTSMLVISIPTFFLGLLAIYVFAFTLGWLPSAGIGPPGESGAAFSISYLAMPASILGLTLAAQLVRYIRGSLIDELDGEYVTTARAKGAGSTRTIGFHALRNALLPVITVLGIYVPQLLAGAVVLEEVFSWPGMGQLALSAVTQRDYPVITGFTILVAIFVLLSSLVTDILYSVADPRVRLQ